MLMCGDGELADGGTDATTAAVWVQGFLVFVSQCTTWTGRVGGRRRFGWSEKTDIDTHAATAHCRDTARVVARAVADFRGRWCWCWPRRRRRAAAPSTGQFGRRECSEPPQPQKLRLESEPFVGAVA